MQGPGVSSVLNLRIPFWANPNGGKATLNKDNLQIPSPGKSPLLLFYFNKSILI